MNDVYLVTTYDCHNVGKIKPDDVSNGGRHVEAQKLSLQGAASGGRRVEA